MLPGLQSRDCDDCTPLHLKTNAFGTRAAVSTLPFCATFIIITIVAYRKVYPLLSSPIGSQAKHYGSSVHSNKLPVPATTPKIEPPTQTLARRIAALTFSSTIALSAVLTELLLCEISNSFNPTARTVALQITVASLLGLLVIAIPLLGISSVISQSGYKFRAEQRHRRRLAWIFEFTGYTIFLTAFWFIGVLLPGSRTDLSEGERLIKDTLHKGRESLFQACLDRLGITGVSLMALLSGFASVSAVWQTFGPKTRIVHETDIMRKQSGLDATNDMLVEKRARLRRIEEKTVEPSTQSFWSSNALLSTFRGAVGGTDTKEKQMLEMEISGLETMASSLETSLSVLRTRRADQLRRTTKTGRMIVGFNYVFACYCVYRIVTTAFAIGRRIIFALFFASSLSRSRSKSGLASDSSDSSSNSDSDSDTDPITSFLALIARYVYPSLNQQSWTQQISFLLSGVMLLASFSAVTQTFHLFSRFLPSLLHATKSANFALLISQVSGMYVISSALMLRGMMPREVGGVINGALGAGMLEPGWVSRWFQGWFFVSCCLTAFGIFIGRSVAGVSGLGDDYYDDGVGYAEGELGMGKRS